MKDKAVKEGNYMAMATRTIEQISVVPKFKPQPGIKWIPYKYGKEYLADKLYQLKCNSALHNSILVSRTDMVYGAGLVDPSDKPVTDLVNETETLNEVFFKVACDYELYNMAAIELRKSAGGKQILINHVPFRRVWLGDYVNNGLSIDSCFYSRDWKDYYKEGYKPVEIPIFKGQMTEPRMMLIVSKYSAGQEFYSLPQYIGALKSIELDAEIDNFDLSSIRNGLQPSLVISFNNGVPNKTVKDALEEQINDKYSGSSNAGKGILLFNESKENAPDIYPIQVNDLDKQYIALNEKVMNKILIGHRIPTPMLVGIKTAGQLGGSNELFEGQQIYYETVIKKDQQVLIDAFNKVGMGKEFTIKDAKPYMYALNDALLSRIASINEQRKLAGLPEIDETELSKMGNDGTK